MNALKAALVRVLLRLCSLLPLRVARALGRGVAALLWPWGGRSRRVIERNLQLAFPAMPGAEREQLARRSFRAKGELAAEMGHLWLRSWRHVQSLVKAVHGAELIRAAGMERRGVIVLAPHLGNWEMVGLHTATLGATVSLYEPPKLAGLAPLIRRARERSGATLVPTDSRGIARLLRSVKRGGISGILPDQVPASLHSGQNAPFMGVPCFTGTLVSNLLHRTGALAVFGYARRVPGGFEVCYRAARPEIYDKDMAVSLAALNRGVQDCLEHCVEQYQWEYKRFRVRPATGPGVYDDL